MGARVVLILAIVYTILITALSLVQLGKISMGEFSPTDKMMHAAAYFFLTLIWLFYYLFKQENKNNKTGPIKISLAAVVFGMLIEVLQGTLTSYRQPDWADILANTTGVLIALLLFTIFRNFLKRVKDQISSFFEKKILH